MCAISGVFQGTVRSTERYVGSYLCNCNCAFVAGGISNDANEEEKKLMDGGCGIMEQYCSDCEYFDMSECVCTHPECGGIHHPLDGEDCEYFSEYDWD